MACCRRQHTTADTGSHLGALFIRISSNLWWASRIRARVAGCPRAKKLRDSSLETPEDWAVAAVGAEVSGSTQAVSLRCLCKVSACGRS